MRRGGLWSDARQDIENLPGIGKKLARKIIEELGDGDPQIALGIIGRNPYSLCEVDGIAFKRADRVAGEEFAIGADDPRRHEAGNRYILEQKGVLAHREFVAERIKLELRDPAHIQSGIEVEDELYWLPEELAAEKGLEGWMRGLSVGEPVLADLTEAQQSVCQKFGLDEQQRRAVQAILANPVILLTGGAGVGKTHIIAAAAQCLDTERGTVRGMAFAGKAADRMREAFDKYGVMAEATTIHKALGFQKGGFTVEMLGEDLIVVDESSMLPNWLAWAVIDRLSPSSRIVFVGDPNQLPPIGYGTPFVDMVKHGLPRVHLLKNYRQQEQQGILHVAEGILNRKRPAPADCVEFHLGVGESNLEPLFKSLVERHGGQDFNDWQAITYQNRNAQLYNLAAQQVINPHGTPYFEYPLWELGTGERNRPKYKAEVRQGDKVIVVKNSGLLGIFNGQTGRVVGQTYKAKQVQRKDAKGGWNTELGDMMMHLQVQIGNAAEPVDIPEDELEKYLQLGYVITVHKAQGSDWDRVIIMQPGDVRSDTARRFFYTASTRAKTHLVIVSMNSVVKWWTNAAADAPEVESSLIKRLGREPVWVCPFCENSGELCACNPDGSPDLSFGPGYAEAAALMGYKRDDEGPASLPVPTPDPAPLAPAAAATPQNWRALRQRPQLPGGAVTEPAQVDVAQVRREFADMEVA